MAYGDNGVGGGVAPSPFAKLLPWTMGKLVGTDAAGGAKTADVQFLVDSGAVVPVVAAPALAGFQVTFMGVRAGSAHDTPVVYTLLKGPTIQAQAKTPAVADLAYDNVFVLLNFPNAPSILGAIFWEVNSGIYKVDIKAGSLAISK